jgi:hypothetical protein
MFLGPLFRVANRPFERPVADYVRLTRGIPILGYLKSAITAPAIR